MCRASESVGKNPLAPNTQKQCRRLANLISGAYFILSGPFSAVFAAMTIWRAVVLGLMLLAPGALAGGAGLDLLAGSFSCETLSYTPACLAAALRL